MQRVIFENDEDKISEYDIGGFVPFFALYIIWQIQVAPISSIVQIK